MRDREWINMQQLTDPHFSQTAAQNFLDAVPEKIKVALAAYAAELDYPVEAVIEMAIAGFLDEDALTFADCKPMTSGGKLKMLDSSG
jgi:hypothetical protein